MSDRTVLPMSKLDQFGGPPGSPLAGFVQMTGSAGGAGSCIDIKKSVADQRIRAEEETGSGLQGGTEAGSKCWRQL